MARAEKRYYTAGDGSRYPLKEAEYDYPITIYKTDCRKSVVGDPSQCLIAMGARRDRLVQAVYIGSGKDAYVVFKPTTTRKAYAVHFTINAKAARVRDFFDTHKGVTTQEIKLSAPTPGRTLAHRSKLNKVRAQKIKNGDHIPTKRGSPRATRITKLGVPHRPKAQIENNVVSLIPRKDREVA